MPAVNVWVPAELLDSARAHRIPLSRALQTVLRDTVRFLETSSPSNSTVAAVCEERAKALDDDEG